jgi:hypothetical protein
VQRAAVLGGQIRGSRGWDALAGGWGRRRVCARRWGIHVLRKLSAKWMVSTTAAACPVVKPRGYTEEVP